MSNKSQLSQILKWKILLTALPLTLLFCVAKLVVHQFKWELGTFDSQTGSLLAAVTFIVAFMLSGTLSDYRTSEDLPDQIVNAIETIQDTNLYIAARKPEYEPKPLTEGLVYILQSILLWLKEGKPIERVENAMTELNQLFVALGQHTEAPLMGRLQTEQAKIRLSIARIQRIRDTDFLASGYALLQLLLVASIVALLFIRTNDFNANLIASGFLFTSFIYLLILIRDLDNPFEYDGKSSTDVDLSPIERLKDRLQQRLI